MFVIGQGRIGGALVAAAKAAGQDWVAISRDSGWDALDGPAGTPILVATRNDDLPAVVSYTPEHRRRDLVFLQNGMLRPWLKAEGLAKNTRGLLFFAVATRGAAIVPGASSPFVGKLADTVASALNGINIDASAVSSDEFKAVELEKLMWNSAFGLLCEALDETVGSILMQHRSTADNLLGELHDVGQRALGIEVPFGPLLLRLHQFSMNVADYKGAVKEWRWRNGWFVDQAKALGMDTPVHNELLASVGR